MLNIRVRGCAVNRATGDRPTPVELGPRDHCLNEPALGIHFSELSIDAFPALNLPQVRGAPHTAGLSTNNIYVVALVYLNLSVGAI